MAPTESGIGRRESLIEKLAKPTPALQGLLVLLGLSLAELAWIHLSKDLIVTVAGTAFGVCTFCAGAVWSMREKVDGALDPDYLSADEYARSRAAHREVRRRSMVQAGIVAVCGLLASTPTLSKLLTGEIYHWMVLAVGVALSRAGYAVLLANAWELQFMEHREKLIHRAKELAEKKALIDSITSSGISQQSFPGWTTGGVELTPPSKH